MKTGDFSFTFHGKDVDILDVAAARKLIIDQVNDPSFESIIGDMKVLANSAVVGPAPRGGEAGVSCKGDTHGNVCRRAGGAGASSVGTVCSGLV